MGLFAQIKGHIHNHARPAQLAALIHQRQFQQPGRLIVQQTMPPFRRHKFGHHFLLGSLGSLPKSMPQVVLGSKPEL